MTLLISLNIYWLREKKTLVEKQNTLQSQVNKLTMANDEEYRIEVQKLCNWKIALLKWLSIIS